MKSLTTLIKSQPLPKLSTVFCAHRRSLLGQDLAQLLHRFVDTSLHEREGKAEGVGRLRCGVSLEVRLQQDLAVLGA